MLGRFAAYDGRRQACLTCLYMGKRQFVALSFQARKQNVHNGGREAYERQDSLSRSQA